MEDEDHDRRDSEDQPDEQPANQASAGARFSLLLVGLVFIGSIICMCAFIFAIAFAS